MHNNILPFTGSAPMPPASGGCIPASKALEDLIAPIVLTPAFAEQIKAFNGLTRDMRAAEIRIQALAFPDNKVFIHPDSVELLAKCFGKELRGLRYRADGRYTRNVVTIRDIDVIWYTPIREQDQ